jgi:hypothetical protein
MAKAVTKTETKKVVAEIQPIQAAQATVYILGTTPLLMNRMTKKTWEYLLLPPRKKNRAALESVLKHDPVAEFRDAVYMNREEKRPALFHMPNRAFHKAIADVAIDIPGATKAQIGRLTSIVNDQIDIYGVPFLHMDTVKQAGISHAPDVRTRAIFKQWACQVTARYIRSLVTETEVMNLLAAAGMIIGIGDDRPQRMGQRGQWEIVAADDPRWLAIVNKQGRSAQAAAINKPVAFDADTEELLAWYETEIKHREAEDKLRKWDDTSAPAKKERRLRAKPDFTPAAKRNGKHRPAKSA